MTHGMNRSPGRVHELHPAQGAGHAKAHHEKPPVVIADVPRGCSRVLPPHATPLVAGDVTPEAPTPPEGGYHWPGKPADHRARLNQAQRDSGHDPARLGQLTAAYHRAQYLAFLDRLAAALDSRGRMTRPGEASRGYPADHREADGA